MRASKEQREERRARTRAATDARHAGDPVAQEMLRNWRTYQDAKRAANEAAHPVKVAEEHARRRQLADKACALALTGVTIPEIAKLTGAAVADIERLARRNPFMFACLGNPLD